MAEECEACGNEPDEGTELNEEGICDNCDGFVELCVSCDQWKRLEDLDEHGVCESCQDDLEEDEEEEEEEDDGN